MRKPIIATRLRLRDYSGYANLGNRIIVSLTGNANFTTPAVTLLDLQAATTDVEDAIAKWSPLGNRGAHADLLDLRQKTVTLAQLMSNPKRSMCSLPHNRPPEMILN